MSVTGLEDALRWATAAAEGERPRLVDWQQVPGGQRYAPYPLLAVIADNPVDDVSWPVSDVLWSYADHYFDGDQRRDIGYSALTSGARHAAARLLSHTDTTTDPAAYNQLAFLFHRSAEWADARHSWQQAIATGHIDSAPTAMLNLGILEEEQGNLDQARHCTGKPSTPATPKHLDVPSKNSALSVDGGMSTYMAKGSAATAISPVPTQV